MRWKNINNRDELQAFYRRILPKLRRVARQHGYALGLHGSMRRDFDLIAAPWVEKFSDKDVLARALQSAATGGISSAKFVWSRKPHGRLATSMAICWTSDRMKNAPSLGHIDLSVAPTHSLYSGEPAKLHSEIRKP